MKCSAETPQKLNNSMHLNMSNQRLKSINTKMGWRLETCALLYIKRGCRSPRQLCDCFERKCVAQRFLNMFKTHATNSKSLWYLRCKYYTEPWKYIGYSNCKTKKKQQKNPVGWNWYKNIGSRKKKIHFDLFVFKGIKVREGKWCYENWEMRRTCEVKDVTELKIILLTNPVLEKITGW